jgi:hypothetical protein
MADDREAFNRRPKDCATSSKEIEQMSDRHRWKDATVSGAHCNCTECGEHAYCMPLHGERGGPLCCLLCIGKWDAKHWQRAILALLDRHSAVYLNDLLSESRTRADYQHLCRVVAGLENAGQIETMSYLARWDHPGHKVLVKPGYQIEDRKEVALLKSSERLTAPKPPPDAPSGHRTSS